MKKSKLTPTEKAFAIARQRESRDRVRNSPIHRHLSQRIISLMRERNLGSWDLCFKGGPRSSKTVYNILNCDTTTTVEMLERFADVFQCELVIEFRPRGEAGKARQDPAIQDTASQEVTGQ